MNWSTSTSATKVSARLYPGCLVKIILGPDHGAEAMIHEGKIGIVVNHIKPSKHIFSSNIWQVLIEGKKRSFHAFDLAIINE
jgi:hypothetical protein